MHLVSGLEHPVPGYGLFNFMLIRRKIAVKVIVTARFKEELLSRLRLTLQNVELSQQQLDEQGRHYLSEIESKDPAQAESFRRKLERQKQRQEEVRARLAEELAGAERLEIGAEYSQGTLEGLVEIGVGDNLSEKLEGTKLVVKDGVVIETHDADRSSA
jgi:hypothetical protein